jgi:uncharacterized protein YdeI (YjbR/CyaY-like superfamily)
MEPLFFATQDALRAWYDAHHDSADELLLGVYKVGSGKPTVTWQQAVDEALCFGWIDGVRHRLDDVSYVNRFTPRRPRSNWSDINFRRVGELIADGRMHPAGLAACEARTPAADR